MAINPSFNMENKFIIINGPESGMSILKESIRSISRDVSSNIYVLQKGCRMEIDIPHSLVSETKLSEINRLLEDNQLKTLGLTRNHE